MKRMIVLLMVVFMGLCGCTNHDDGQGVEMSQDGGGVVQDAGTLKDLIIEGVKEIVAKVITVDNCTVPEGSKLTLTASESIEINPPFEVEQGAELEMSVQADL